jgi:phosphatidylserine/phosphatidylglycerophosphate/cardiolipin synthase-like enzyme
MSECGVVGIDGRANGNAAGSRRLEVLDPVCNFSRSWRLRAGARRGAAPVRAYDSGAMKSRILAAAACLAAAASIPAHAKVPSVLQPQAITVPAAGTLEVAFSPDEGSERLVVKVIDNARRELRVLAYSFTSPAVTEALVRARHRGVDVKVIADQKENTSQDRSGKARAALSTLALAGADVRLISVYPIHHDKVIVADRSTVEIGSFNYSAAAAERNSENVLVNWGNTQLAQVYLAHFARNLAQSTPFSTKF